MLYKYTPCGILIRRIGHCYRSTASKLKGGLELYIICTMVCTDYVFCTLLNAYWALTNMCRYFSVIACYSNSVILIDSCNGDFCEDGRMECRNSGLGVGLAVKSSH